MGCVTHNSSLLLLGRRDGASSGVMSIYRTRTIKRRRRTRAEIEQLDRQIVEVPRTFCEGAAMSDAKTICGALVERLGGRFDG